MVGFKPRSPTITQELDIAFYRIYDNLKGPFVRNLRHVFIYIRDFKLDTKNTCVFSRFLWERQTKNGQDWMDNLYYNPKFFINAKLSRFPKRDHNKSSYGAKSFLFGSVNSIRNLGRKIWRMIITSMSLKNWSSLSKLFLVRMTSLASLDNLSS